jgi:hypothetical protein
VATFCYGRKTEMVTFGKGHSRRHLFAPFPWEDSERFGTAEIIQMTPQASAHYGTAQHRCYYLAKSCLARYSTAHEFLRGLVQLLTVVSDTCD